MSCLLGINKSQNKIYIGCNCYVQLNKRITKNTFKALKANSQFAFCSRLTNITYWIISIVCLYPPYLSVHQVAAKLNKNTTSNHEENQIYIQRHRRTSFPTNRQSITQLRCCRRQTDTSPLTKRRRALQSCHAFFRASFSNKQNVTFKKQARLKSIHGVPFSIHRVSQG